MESVASEPAHCLRISSWRGRSSTPRSALPSAARPRWSAAMHSNTLSRSRIQPEIGERSATLSTSKPHSIPMSGQRRSSPGFTREARPGGTTLCIVSMRPRLYHDDRARPDARTRNRRRPLDANSMMPVSDDARWDRRRAAPSWATQVRHQRPCDRPPRSRAPRARSFAGCMAAFRCAFSEWRWGAPRPPARPTARSRCPPCSAVRRRGAQRPAIDSGAT